MVGKVIAVGSVSFVTNVKRELGFKAAHREVTRGGRGTCVFAEGSEAYGFNFAGENEVLSSENTRFWNGNPEGSAT